MCREVHMAMSVPVALLSVALPLMLVPNNLGVQWKTHALNDYHALNLLCVCAALSSLTGTATIKCDFRLFAITSIMRQPSFPRPYLILFCFVLSSGTETSWRSGLLMDKLLQAFFHLAGAL